MKKMIFGAAAALLLASCSGNKGKVEIHLPSDYSDSTLVVSYVTIENAFNAKTQDDLKIVYDTLAVRDGIATMTLADADARYDIEPPIMTTMHPEFYASKGDDLTIEIKSFEPLLYDVRGSELMEDIMAFYSKTHPIQLEYINLINSGDSISPDAAKAIMDRYDATVRKFADENPKSPAIPFVILELSGDDFKKYYDNMSDEAKKSILMPYAELYNRDVEQMMKEREEEEARKDEVASGKKAAPGFSLPDISGKTVSLSDFKGKWVVLDFWGTWCGWCVKGFPALKEAYSKYGDKIVVIGIDCNESEAEWREGVKKYELPWINVYNGNDSGLYQAYNITGFPTKAIINPEGNLVDLTTGEDPSFYDRLAAFVK